MALDCWRSKSWDQSSTWRWTSLTSGLLAPCWPAVTASVASWFPDQQLNSVFGFVNTATFAGGLAGTGLASGLLQYSGWRSVGLPPSLLTLAVSLLVSLLLSSPPEAGLTVPGKTAGPASQQTKEGQKTESLLSLAQGKIQYVFLSISPLLLPPFSRLKLGHKSPEKVWTKSPDFPPRKYTKYLGQIPCVVELSSAMFSLKFVRYCMAMWLPLYLLEALGYDKLQARYISSILIGRDLQSLEIFS